MHFTQLPKDILGEINNHLDYDDYCSLYEAFRLDGYDVIKKPNIDINIHLKHKNGFILKYSRYHKDFDKNYIIPTLFVNINYERFYKQKYFYGMFVSMYPCN